MNLAWKDLSRQAPRFVLTGVGLGLLFTVVLAMSGIYRGLTVEATQLADSLGPDLWVVQRDTRGPFAERSAVPEPLRERLRLLEGVSAVRSFTYTTLQREMAGTSLRVALAGLDWPEDGGGRLPLRAGRPLESAHREMIADESLGLALGARVPFGDDTWTVVGLTRGFVSAGGDGVAFVTLSDAAAILTWQAPDAIRAEREARAARLDRSDLASLTLGERVRDDRASLPVLPPFSPHAMIVSLAPGADEAAIVAKLAAWPDITAYTAAGQRALLLGGVVEKSRMQLGVFRALLSVVSAIIMALILYNMTVAKSREIALLKLMGARTSVIVGMILQESLLLGATGLGVAVGLGKLTFDHFPRRVVVTSFELGGMAALVVLICIVASLAGIWRALRIPPTLLLAG
ncbi:MAG: ABC transporter permease [Pseudomonadota bacterium]|nr:ABC transporter permease [Pseudomonadota bacterium]